MGHWLFDSDARQRKLKELEYEKRKLERRREELGITPEEEEAVKSRIAVSAISYLFPSIGNLIEKEKEKDRQEQERIIADRRAEERHQAEIRKINSESSGVETETRRKLELVKMIKQIRKNDLPYFPVELKYFVIACQAGDVEALNDIMQANVLKDYLARKQEAEVTKLEREVGIIEQNIADKRLDVENKQFNLDAKRRR